MTKRYFFSKEERLCNLSQIDQLYKQGSSFSFYPFRIVHRQSPIPQTYPIQVLISVPKRKFKRAVDRNKLKRMIREVYRKIKEDHLYPKLLSSNRQIQLMIIYTGNEIITAKNLEKKLNLALNRLI